MQSFHCPASRSVINSGATTDFVDQYDVDLFLASIETSESNLDKKHFIEILKRENLNKDVFFEAVFNSIFNCSENLKIENFLCFLEVLPMTNDFELISRVISKILRSYNFWLLKSSVVMSLLTNILSFVSLYKNQLVFDVIASDYTLAVLCVATTFDKENSNLILDLISLISNNVKQLSNFQHIVYFSLIEPYFNLNSDVEQTIANTMLMKTTKLQTKLAEMVLTKDGSLNEIPYSVLIHFTYYWDDVVAKQCSIELIKRIKEKESRIAFLPLISKVLKRFSGDLNVWGAVLRELTDGEFEFDSNDKIVIKEPNYLALLIEMFTSFIENQPDNFNLIFETMRRTFSSAGPYFSRESLIPYILDFIISNLYEDSESTPPIYSMKLIPEELKNDFTKSYPKWKEIFISAYQRRNEKVSFKYINAVAELLTEATIELQNPEPFILMICQNANPLVLQNYICTLISNYRRIAHRKDIDKAIYRSLIFIICRRSNVLLDGSIYKLLIDISREFPDLFNLFRNIIVFNLDKIGPEIVEYIINYLTEILHKSFTLHTLIFSVFFFTRLLKSGLPLEMPFIVSYFTFLKKCIIHFNDVDSIPYGRQIVTTKNITDLKTNDNDFLSYDEIFKGNLSKFEDFCDKNVIQFNENNALHTTESFYQLFMETVIKQCNYKNLLFKSFDFSIRKSECYNANLIYHKGFYESQQLLCPKENIHSYVRSPFFDLCTVPTVILPSNIVLHPPGEERKPERNKNFLFKGVTPKYSYGKGFYDASFNNNLMAQIIHVYGGKKFTNVMITRLYSKVVSVLFFVDDGIMCIVGATYNGSEINLLSYEKNEDKDKLEEYLYMKECILDGQFGPFSLFAGHPMIYINFSYAKMYSYIHLGNQQSVQVFSKMNGVMIIEFLDQQMPLTPLRFDLSPYVFKWIAGLLTNYDYLLCVNQAAVRSFVDLSCYPIFPRILADFTGESISDFRDLTLPVQIVKDKDQQHTNLNIRYEVQGYHHSENISNPHFVSSFLIRLSPFCNAQWELNGKWDDPNRTVISLPNHMTITNKTTYELIPEAFSFVECFSNVNKLVIQPDNVVLDTEFPKWANNADEFIKIHRNALESNAVRESLSDWLDIAFGYKLKEPDSVTSLNTYSPMSYVEVSETSQEQDTQNILGALLSTTNPTKFEQRDWISTCGQVPHQVFKISHNSVSKSSSYNEMDWDEPLSVEIKIDDDKQTIHIMEASFSPNIGDIIHAFCDGRAVVLTTEKFVATFALPSFLPLSILYKQNTTKSATCGKLMICATLLDNLVIIWSLANGHISTIIEVKEKPISLYFQKNTHNLAITTETEKMIYTPNGTKLQ